MTKPVPFFKMVASGNDFIVIDNRKKVISDPKKFVTSVCDRHEGIGADGVLLIEKKTGKTGDSPPRRGQVLKKGDRSWTKKTEDLSPFLLQVLDQRDRRPVPFFVDYRLRIFNADGSAAEACGNGFRCVAWLAHERFGFGKKQRFESPSGVIEAEIKGKRVRVQWARPSDWKGPETIEVSGRELRYHFVNTGVPHTVIFVEGLSQIPVETLGRAVRSHSRFSPAGTNVNFVEVIGRQTISVRTYERGVEAETLACGTGAAASALMSARLGFVKLPVKVITRGGEILLVDFTEENVFLEGGVKLVFEGRYVY